MKFFINKLIINGIKNLNKPIELNFTNKTLTKDYDFSKSNVKAIYGPNGSGKSGIIAAIFIYKNLISNLLNLNNQSFFNFILETINKETNNFSIEIYFSAINKNKITSCYKHFINLKNDNNDIIISKEEISILKGNVINKDKFQRLFMAEEGKISEIFGVKKDQLTDNYIYINSMNLLDKNSIVNIFGKLINNFLSIDMMGNDVFDAIFEIFIFSQNLNVMLNYDDVHYNYIYNKVLEQTLNNNKTKSEFINLLRENLSNIEINQDFSIKDYDVVFKKDFVSYKKTIDNLTDFIRIFKPSLKEIIIDKKINGDKYLCRKILKYNNFEIDIEFESAGIKKLVKLYTILKQCSNGQIAFIDEMDANLHDVYFSKMIEFFKIDGKGQLCFTTHNLEPINILKDNNYSLDFLSNDSRLFSWKKNGNKSPLNNYINGLIPYSPFLVESFDFDILLDEEK